MCPLAAGSHNVRTSALPPAAVAAAAAAAASGAYVGAGRKSGASADYEIRGGEVKVNEGDYDNGVGSVSASSSWVPQTISEAPRLEAVTEGKEADEVAGRGTAIGGATTEVGGTGTTRPSVWYSTGDVDSSSSGSPRQKTVGVVVGGLASAATVGVASNAQSTRSSTTSGDTYSHSAVHSGRSGGVAHVAIPQQSAGMAVQGAHVFSDDEGDTCDDDSVDAGAKDSAAGSEDNESLASRAKTGVFGIKGILPSGSKTSASSTATAGSHGGNGIRIHGGEFEATTGDVTTSTHKGPENTVTTTTTSPGGTVTTTTTTSTTLYTETRRSFERTTSREAASSYGFSGGPNATTCSYEGNSSNNAGEGTLGQATTVPGVVAPWRPTSGELGAASATSGAGSTVGNERSSVSGGVATRDANSTMGSTSSADGTSLVSVKDLISNFSGGSGTPSGSGNGRTFSAGTPSGSESGHKYGGSTGVTRGQGKWYSSSPASAGYSVNTSEDGGTTTVAYSTSGTGTSVPTVSGLGDCWRSCPPLFAR